LDIASYFDFHFLNWRCIKNRRKAAIKARKASIDYNPSSKPHKKAMESKKKKFQNF